MILQGSDFMKVLEINVDDNGMGGVYALVNNVIHNKPEILQLDIACITRFENQEHIEELKDYGTHVFYVGTEKKLKRPFEYYKKTIGLLNSKQYDCVHIHGDVAYLLLIFAMAAEKSGVKRIILHSHAAGVDGRARSIKKILHDATKKRLKRHGSLFVACSDVAAKWMFPNINQNKIIMIHNGINLVDFKFCQNIRDEQRKQLGVTNDYLVGHVGRFAYQKNHDFLIRAFAEIKKKISNAKLILIGEGILMNEVKNEAKKLGLQEDIIFYGACHNVNELMQAMDLFVLPSHFEGLPVVGVEAQAAGLPVLFSDQITKEARQTENVRFLSIENGQESVWAQNAFEIKNNNSYDRSLGEKVLENRGFSINNTVKEFLELYS